MRLGRNRKYQPLWNAGATPQGIIDFVERRSKYFDEGPPRKGEATIINRGLKATLSTF